MNVSEGDRRMGAIRRTAIGVTLALGVAMALMIGTWAFLRPPEPRPLGPYDGHDLSGLDTGRVAVGDVAPDFTLVSYAGSVVTLSDFRGQKNVVLQFYRGHW